MEASAPYWFPLAQNILRYAVLAGLPFLVFYICWGHRFLKNKIQGKDARRQDFYRELTHSLQTILVFSGVGMLIRFSPLKTYSLIYAELDAYPLWWLPVSVLIALIIHDTYFYWTHRAMHHRRLFKGFHLVHHRSTNPTPLAAYSFNLLESMVEALVLPLIIFVIPMHPLALIAFYQLMLVFNVYGHLGFEIAPRWFRHSFLFEIMNTSVHHNLHHKKFRGNYGLYFRVWDRLMGTEHPDYVRDYDAVQARRFGEPALYGKPGRQHSPL